MEAEVRTEESACGSGRRVDWWVRNPGRSPLVVDRVALPLPGLRFSHVLEHGWQSWSVVRRCPVDDVRPQRRSVPWWQRALYLADPARAGAVVQGDQFLVGDSGVAGFLDGRAHVGVVSVEPSGEVTAWALLDGIELAPGEERALDPVWVGAGDPGALYSEFAAHWGAAMGARASTPAPLGWCSWYHYYDKVTPDAVRANAALAAAHGVEVAQIDDGYQAAIGEWLQGRPGWDMPALASSIRGAGMQAGIWTAPFLVDEGGAVATAHPDWLLRAADGSGEPVRAMWNPALWGGWALALDTTRPAVVDHLHSVFASLHADGFDYHKIDFCYAAAMPGRRHQPALTRAQALRLGLDAVRSAIGDDAFLLGCGSPFGPAVGVVDAMRVSEDVSPSWRPRPSGELPGLEETASCARNAIGTSLLRAPLHRRLWANDPDCVLLRPTETELTPEQRSVLVTSVEGGGGFTILSDDLSLYGDAEWAAVERLRGAPDLPLDLVDPFASPLVVTSAGGRLTCEWQGDAPFADYQRARPS